MIHSGEVVGRPWPGFSADESEDECLLPCIRCLSQAATVAYGASRMREHHAPNLVSSSQCSLSAWPHRYLLALPTLAEFLVRTSVVHENSGIMTCMRSSCVLGSPLHPTFLFYFGFLSSFLVVFPISRGALCNLTPIFRFLFKFDTGASRLRYIPHLM